jgi:hypothetical protein
MERKRIRLIEGFGVGETTISTGITRKTNATLENAYAVAKIFETSIEELLDGEAGTAYIRKIVKNDPKAIQVPDRILPIVEQSMFFSIPFN